MKPSYHQLEIELTDTKKELAETTERLRLASEEVADLKERLKLNSKNSSKPPSTDYKANTTSKSRKECKCRKGVARTTFPPEKVDKSIECT